MAAIRSKFMSLPFAPAVATMFHNLWPVAFGATTGDILAQAADWHYPWVAAIVTGALVQVLIALLRSWFSERRDLMQTMKAMLQEQRTYWSDQVRTEKDERHQMANRAAKAEMKLFALAHGVPAHRIAEPPALYPEVEENNNAEH